MANRRLDGKVALITGAAGGIGAASAKLFAQEGAVLVITDASPLKLSELETELCQSHFSVLAISGDLSDEHVVEGLFKASAERYGRLDILFNNAGVMITGSIDEVTTADLNAAFSVNLTAQAIAVKHAASLMRKSRGGAIVNTASMGGLMGFEGMIAYTASKAAIIGLTKSLALEFAKDSIRVNAIAPGIVDTQMPRKLLQACADSDRTRVEESFYRRQLMKRFATPHEIAHAAMFLASDDASFITGVILPVDGGWSCW